jgi:subtilisin family serine protease
MKLIFSNKRKIYYNSLLLVLIINASFLSIPELNFTSERVSFTANSWTQSHNNLSIETLSHDSEDFHLSNKFITVTKASGESYELPIPTGINTIQSFSVNGKTSIFINDLEGGDKIEPTLRDYTFLWENDYIKEDRIRVILLPGSQISREVYTIKTLSSNDVSLMKEQLEQFQGNILSKFNNFPFLTVDLPYNEIFNLVKQDNIAHIFLDKKVYACLDESVPIIKPPSPWQELENDFGLKVNGSNIKIAILDTGIDKNHPDLDDMDDNSSTTDPKVIAEKCFTGEGYASDGHGHGTHCASITAGTGEASNYTYIGVAPSALLLNGKVLRDNGRGYNSWIINGIEWAVNQSVDIISMSLGQDINGDGTDPLSLALDWATDQGVICIVAAGNEGGTGMFSIGIPAVARKVITVGSTTKNDEISSFSSQGPTNDYRLKPDVCAPGSHIIAARASDTNMGNPIDTYYTSASGTSMATPHVAGAAALILQIHINWEPLMVKSALMGNTKILSNEHLWRQGAGRIDVAKAINTTLLIVEPSVSFGMMEGGGSLNQTFNVMNLKDTEVNIDLALNTTCDGEETNYVNLNVSSLTIPAFSDADVSLNVGPLDENAPEGWFEGRVNITGISQNYKTAPYLFVAMSSISVNMLDIDNLTPIFAIIALTSYPNISIIDIQNTYEGDWGPDIGSAQFYVKEGNYSLCAQAPWIDYGSGNKDLSRMFMIEKNITVPRYTNVNLSLNLVDTNKHSIPTLDSKGNNLIVHSYTQYFSGGPQTWYEDHFQESQWSLGGGWFGFDLNTTQLTFYSSNYSQPDKFCEAIGYYGSDLLLSEVYLVPLKYWNVSSLPVILGCSSSDFAKYDFFYDMPETYPENSLLSSNAFWFTWDHLAGIQLWGNNYYEVPAGLNATYYLAPDHGTYFGDYASTYKGWDLKKDGPLQSWKLGKNYPYPQIPFNKSETGNMNLGNYTFTPYHPGLNLNVSDLGTEYLLHLTGDIWSNLSWPHTQWIYIYPIHGYASPYPPFYANYSLFINEILYDQGVLNGHQGHNGEPFVHYPPYSYDVDWCGINETWTITEGNIRLQLDLPSLATLFSNTVYNLTFNLGGGDSTPPILNKIACPTNFTPGEDIFINFTASDDGLGIDSHYLKYSFNNGTTWQTASYENPYYRIPCIEADALTLLINVTDQAGNSLQFFSNPVALCNKVKINVPSEICAFTGDPIIISGNLTSVEGYGLPGMAVLLANNGTTFAMTDDNGKFNLLLAPIDDPGNYTYDIAFASAGVYNKQKVSITLRLTEDTEPPSWVELPTDQFVEFGENFTYDLNAIDLAGISHWWIDDTTHFSIDNNGDITNNILLPVEVYGIKVWVNDTHSNIQNASFNVIVQDTSPPEWSPIPSDIVINRGDDLKYDLNATDLSGIDYWWINDTTHFSIDNYGIITITTQLMVGEYWLEIRAYDPYDNYCFYTIKITVEEVPSGIPGYNLILLLGVIFIISAILIKRKVLKLLK